MPQMDSLDLGLYHYPAYPIAESLPRAQALAKLIGSFRGKPLHVFETTTALMEAERDTSFETIGAFICLVHPELGTPGFWFVHLNQFIDAGWAVQHVVATIMPYDRSGMADSWAFMMEFAPKLVALAEPSVDAGLGGISDFPDPRKLEANALPPLNAWNWLSKKLVDTDRLAMLEAIGFHKVEALGEGYVVEVVPDVYTKPSKEVVAAMKAHGLSFKAPNPPKG